MTRGRAGRLASTLRALLACSALIATPARGEPWRATDPADLQPRVLAVDGIRVAIRTPAALYRFQPESEAWTTLTEQEGLPEPPLASLTLSAEQLWIGGTGVAFSDPAVDAWRRYAPGEGYPGRRVNRVEADEDYAYAAIDSGAARLDRYVLEWEALNGPAGHPLGPVADVAVGTDRVWFALARGVAEFRKSSEAFRVDSLLGQLRAPVVLVLRQSGRCLWAITDAGVARYDKELETWTSYAPGVDLPDARVHQVTLQGEDLFLGTDAGLWRYNATSAIWRRDDRTDAMPGVAVLAFSLDNGLWVATDQAYASYEDEGRRWIDFSQAVPLPPGEALEMAWAGGAFLLVGRDRILHAARPPDGNPNLLNCREFPILRQEAITSGADQGWRPVLDDAGLGLRRSAEEFVALKGGATLYVVNDDGAGGGGFGSLATDTRFDLALNGRLRGDRTLSGLYDTTDPDNEAYWIDGRGSRSDVLREVAAGEIEQAFFNTSLVPGAGLRGGRARVETGTRSEATRRRQLTVDGWAGERRTFPGRVVFYGPRELYVLGYRNLVRESERIRVDRQVLKLEQDYSIDWVNGLFVLGDHVLLDDDTPVEVTFQYEVEADADAGAALPDDRALVAAQAGWAASDLLFLVAQGQRCRDEQGRGTTTTDLNARLEHRSQDAFLRLTPELGLSWTDATTAEDGGTQGTATGVDLRGRYHGLQVTTTHRAFGEDFGSLTDRRTLLGRLREESEASARLDIGTHWQGTLDWNRTLSDRVGASLSDLGGRGRESLLMGGVRFLHAGLPNLGVRYGRVRQDSLGIVREKRIARGELEIAPDAATLQGIGIKRLWLRAFFQRSDRQSGEQDRRVTDHAFLRLNGSAGTPLSWNLGLEDRWTYRPRHDGPRGRRRVQEVTATLQAQPHAAFDLFANWDANRDLAWRPAGGPDGFSVRRSLSGSAHLYPGRVTPALVPLTLRVELNRSGEDLGTAGEALPSSASLWSPWALASQSHDQRLVAVESWWQAHARLRLVDRLEQTTGEQSLGDSTDVSTLKVFENRLEIRPEAGLVTVRLRFERHGADPDGPPPPTVIERTRRFTSEWNQAWGGGWGSYVTAEAGRTKDVRPRASHLVRTQGRLTCRRNRWRLDASLGASGTLNETYVAKSGVYAYGTQRELTLDTTWSVQPVPILTAKLTYDVRLVESRHPNHGLDLRLLLRI